MQRKRLGYILIGGGLVLALFVGIMVYSQVSDAEQVKASLPTARVVIATGDIPARTEIAASMVNVRTVPDELVQAGAATKVEDVVGKFSPDAITKGAVINTQKIGPVAVKNAPSFRIEKGKVMYVMPVSFAGSQFSLAQVNALRAGDRVDLLYTTINAPQGLTPEQRDEVRANPIPYLQTRIMLQDLRIQEIGSYAPDGSLVPATGDPTAKGAAPALANANIIFIVAARRIAGPEVAQGRGHLLQGQQHRDGAALARRRRTGRQQPGGQLQLHAREVQPRARRRRLPTAGH